ncbi:MAG: hypothetical protein AB7R40_25895 [Nitrospiraceae bacterium]
MPRRTKSRAWRPAPVISRRFLLLVGAALFGCPTPALSEVRTVSGQAGILGEWELTATVSEQAVGRTRHWTGPLTMRHVGFCGADGPEEKTGELRLRISDPGNAMTATLLIDGAECSFTGQLKDSYDGVMKCPDRRAVPMMLVVQ